MGDVSWSLPEYCHLLPKFYTWDFLIPIMGNYLSEVPVGPSDFQSMCSLLSYFHFAHRFDKIYIAPCLHIKRLAFSWKIWSKIFVSHSETNRKRCKGTLTSSFTRLSKFPCFVALRMLLHFAWDSQMC